MSERAIPHLFWCFLNTSTFKSTFKDAIMPIRQRRTYELSNSDNHSGQYYWPEKNPMGTVAEGEGDAVAILNETNRRSIAFHQNFTPTIGNSWRCWVKRCCWWAHEKPGNCEVNLDDLWTGFWPQSTEGMAKLGHTIREQFKKKLAERLENHAYPQPGYMVMLIAIKSNFGIWLQTCISSHWWESRFTRYAVGRRESSEVYQIADMRWTEPAP